MIEWLRRKKSVPCDDLLLEAERLGELKASKEDGEGGVHVWIKARNCDGKAEVWAHRKLASEAVRDAIEKARAFGAPFEVSDD